MAPTAPTQLRAAVTRQPVAVALLLSLLLHGGGYGVYWMAKHFGWQPPPLPKWLRLFTGEKLLALPKPGELKPDAAKPLTPPIEVPPALTLIEVDPSLAAPEPPTDAKFYSAVNARAANPEIKIQSDLPNIDGRETKVPRLADAPKPQPLPLQPQAPPQSKAAEPKEQPAPAKPSPEIVATKNFEAVKPAETKPLGDLALARPSPMLTDGDRSSATVRPESATPKRNPPRTLAEALQRQPQLAGQKMKQDGGVRNLRLESSVDARGTPFGAYDLAFVQIVQQEWYHLLENKLCPGGKVVIEFRLLHTGRVENARITENDVGELFALYCQLAITKPRFDPWPGDMRRLFGEHRDVRFTFYYN